MQTTAANYPWATELEKTIINSLTTTFGLDFLLFKDKDGGDVDTIHNVRQGIYATDKEKQLYEQREKYNKEISKGYHSHDNYKNTGKRDKTLQQEGKLHDAYRDQTMLQNEQRNLDHIIAAKEIHDDAGRILADLDGKDLANKSSNLQTTIETINKSKKEKPVSDYLDSLPRLIQERENELAKKENRLKTMTRETPKENHEYRELEDEIRKKKNGIDNLKKIDPQAMRAKDKKARTEYETTINTTYYSSSKFIQQTGHQAGISGMKMGTRQMLGLIMAEVWFELRIQLPEIIATLKNNFSFERFISRIKRVLQGIWRRIQERFKDFLTSFKDGVFGGILSSVTTTIFNIFATTYKSTVKIIREIWGQLVKAIKLLFLNPDNLDFVELCKAVIGVLSAAAGVAIGSIAHTHLLPLCNFPFGGELAAFAGALVTGIATLGLTYLMLHSSLAQKIWTFIESIMPHAGTVKKYQAINAELDRYLMELARLEFNMDPQELAEFSNELADCNDEIQRGLVLKDEVTKRGVELPYEIGNSASTRKWLISLTK